MCRFLCVRYVCVDHKSRNDGNMTPGDLETHTGWIRCGFYGQRNIKWPFGDSFYMFLLSTSHLWVLIIIIYIYLIIEDCLLSGCIIIFCLPHSNISLSTNTWVGASGKDASFTAFRWMPQVLWAQLLAGWNAPCDNSQPCGKVWVPHVDRCPGDSLGWKGVLIWLIWICLQAEVKMMVAHADFVLYRLPFLGAGHGQMSCKQMSYSCHPRVPEFVLLKWQSADQLPSTWPT